MTIQSLIPLLPLSLLLSFLQDKSVPSVAPSFDVVSVKHLVGPPHGPVGTFRYDPNSGRLAFMGMFSQLLYRADISGTKGGAFSGEPPWMSSLAERYEVEALAAKGTTLATVRLMLRRTLEERFGLRYHSEDRIMNVYALVLGTEPLQLIPAKPGASRSLSNGAGHYKGIGTLADFADYVGHYLGRPVLDKTGNSARLSFDLDWTNEVSEVQTDDSDHKQESDTGPYFRVVKKLGLRLKPQKAPMKFLVIDHAEKEPTAN